MEQPQEIKPEVKLEKDQNMILFEEKTGKHAIYAGKVTKQYEKFKAKQNKASVAPETKI